MDNVTLNAAVGTFDVATDEIAGEHYQKVKLAFGALDTASLVTASIGLPTNLVQIAGTAPGAANPLPVRLSSGSGFLATLPVSIAADPLPVRGADQTAFLYDGDAALVPKFAAIVADQAGATEVVAAVPGKTIRVLRFSLSVSDNVNVKFQSDSNDLTGLLYITQYGGHAPAYCPVGLFETAAGEALNIHLSAGVAVGGFLGYVEV